MTTLVVGAGQGIGYEFVNNFIREYPDREIIAISRNIKNLKQLEKKSNFLSVIKCDITSENDLKNLNEILTRNKIKITYLINFAGILIKKNWEKFSQKDFLEIYNTNVYAPFNLIRTISKQLSKNQKGHIVHIGSMGGVEGSLKFPGMIFYSSSKAALSCLSECLAEELKNKGIHVNCVALGAVETEMKKKAFPNFKAPHSAAQIATYLIRFLIEDRGFFNGKVIKASISVP